VAGPEAAELPGARADGRLPAATRAPAWGAFARGVRGAGRRARTGRGQAAPQRLNVPVASWPYPCHCAGVSESRSAQAKKPAFAPSEYVLFTNRLLRVVK